MKGIKIISPGFYTTIQDLGRTGYQKFGMSQSGAMDWFSLELANILVGNKRGEACLEVTFIGPEIAFEIDSQIAISGADISPKLNDKPITLNKSFSVSAGDTLRFGTLKCGCRAYISFAGGLQVSTVMGSKSTYAKAALGGNKGRALKEGNEIPLIEVNAENNEGFSFEGIPPLLNRNWYEIHIVPGPEVDHFSWKGLETFLNSTFQISAESDRMGYRLTGAQIEKSKTVEMLSSGIANGTIQVPANGQPIVLLSERQTTGGYPRIANVITADLPLLGQLKPDDSIKFVEVNNENAVERLQEKMNLLDEISTAVSVHNQK